MTEEVYGYNLHLRKEESNQTIEDSRPFLPFVFFVYPSSAFELKKAEEGKERGEED